MGLVIDLGWAGEALPRMGTEVGLFVRGFLRIWSWTGRLPKIAEILSPGGLGILWMSWIGLVEILAPLRLLEMLQLVIVKRVASCGQGGVSGNAAALDALWAAVGAECSGMQSRRRR